MVHGVSTSILENFYEVLLFRTSENYSVQEHTFFLSLYVSSSVSLCLALFLCLFVSLSLSLYLHVNLNFSSRFQRTVPVTTSSVNFAQFSVHLPVLPQPPLSIRLSPPGLTTVVLFILVSLPLA